MKGHINTKPVMKGIGRFDHKARFEAMKECWQRLRKNTNDFVESSRDFATKASSEEQRLVALREKESSELVHLKNSSKPLNPERRN